MSKRGPLAATDRRRQAGHKHARQLGDDEEHRERNGAGKRVANLFNDRRQRIGEGKRAS